MEPFSTSSILSAIGLSSRAISWVKKSVTKKVKVTPHSVTTTSKKWDSKNSIVIQNITEQPLFNIDIVCWYSEGITIEFHPHHVVSVQNIGDIEMDTMLYLINGVTDDGRKLHILKIDRLLPKENIVIDLQIHNRGNVQFVPASYSKDRPAEKLIKKDSIGISFQVPYKMTLESMSFWMKKSK